VVDLQDGVLLDHAEEHEDAERGIEVERIAVYQSESSANGTDSGRESRMVRGWIRLSN
jgi:hypothetical protein